MNRTLIHWININLNVSGQEWYHTIAERKMISRKLIQWIFETLIYWVIYLFPAFGYETLSVRTVATRHHSFCFTFKAQWPVWICHNF